MTFRKSVGDFENADLNNPKLIINKIDQINKEKNVNLIVFNFNKETKIDKDLESYLIQLNKKILIISKDKVNFVNYFLNRTEVVSNYFLTYFNNDIQYGSKYILKRVIDIFISIFGIIIFF